jgi:hypothetical protein
MAEINKKSAHFGGGKPFLYHDKQLYIGENNEFHIDLVFQKAAHALDDWLSGEAYAGRVWVDEMNRVTNISIQDKERLTERTVYQIEDALIQHYGADARPLDDKTGLTFTGAPASSGHAPVSGVALRPDAWGDSNEEQAEARLALAPHLEQPYIAVAKKGSVAYSWLVGDEEHGRKANCVGLITEMGGTGSHFAIVAGEYSLPYITEAPQSTKIRTLDQITIYNDAKDSPFSLPGTVEVNGGAEASPGQVGEPTHGFAYSHGSYVLNEDSDSDSKQRYLESHGLWDPNHGTHGKVHAGGYFHHTNENLHPDAHEEISNFLKGKLGVHTVSTDEPLYQKKARTEKERWVFYIPEKKLYTKVADPDNPASGEQLHAAIYDEIEEEHPEDMLARMQCIQGVGYTDDSSEIHTYDREPDIEKALKDVGYKKFRYYEKDASTVHKCPHCGSHTTFLLDGDAQQFQCHNCGKEFKDKNLIKHPKSAASEGFTMPGIKLLPLAPGTRVRAVPKSGRDQRFFGQEGIVVKSLDRDPWFDGFSQDNGPVVEVALDNREVAQGMGDNPSDNKVWLYRKDLRKIGSYWLDEAALPMEHFGNLVDEYTNPYNDPENSIVCPHCNGDGSEPGKFNFCSVCGGYGRITKDRARELYKNSRYATDGGCDACGSDSVGENGQCHHCGYDNTWSNEPRILPKDMFDASDDWMSGITASSMSPGYENATCPNCSSDKITVNTREDTAHCYNCGWVGYLKDLVKEASTPSASFGNGRVVAEWEEESGKYIVWDTDKQVLVGQYDSFAEAKEVAQDYSAKNPGYGGAIPAPWEEGSGHITMGANDVSPHIDYKGVEHIKPNHCPRCGETASAISPNQMQCVNGHIFAKTVEKTAGKTCPRCNAQMVEDDEDIVDWECPDCGYIEDDPTHNWEDEGGAVHPSKEASPSWNSIDHSVSSLTDKIEAEGSHVGTRFGYLSKDAPGGGEALCNDHDHMPIMIRFVDDSYDGDWFALQMTEQLWGGVEVSPGPSGSVAAYLSSDVGRNDTVLIPELKQYFAKTCGVPIEKVMITGNAGQKTPDYGHSTYLDYTPPGKPELGNKKPPKSGQQALPGMEAGKYGLTTNVKFPEATTWTALVETPYGQEVVHMHSDSSQKVVHYYEAQGYKAIAILPGSFDELEFKQKISATEYTQRFVVRYDSQKDIYAIWDLEQNKPIFFYGSRQMAINEAVGLNEHPEEYDNHPLKGAATDPINTVKSTLKKCPNCGQINWKKYVSQKGNKKYECLSCHMKYHSDPTKLKGEAPGVTTGPAAAPSALETIQQYDPTYEHEEDDLVYCTNCDEYGHTSDDPDYHPEPQSLEEALDNQGVSKQVDTLEDRLKGSTKYTSSRFGYMQGLGMRMNDDDHMPIMMDYLEKNFDNDWFAMQMHDQLWGVVNGTKGSTVTCHLTSDVGKIDLGLIPEMKDYLAKAFKTDEANVHISNAGNQNSSDYGHSTFLNFSPPGKPHLPQQRGLITSSRIAKVADTKGNPLTPGRTYVMHSTKYKVPDVVMIKNVHPDHLEAVIAGDDKGYFPINITLDDYNKYNYSFEPKLAWNPLKKKPRPIWDDPKYDKLDLTSQLPSSPDEAADLYPVTNQHGVFQKAEGVPYDPNELYRWSYHPDKGLWIWPAMEAYHNDWDSAIGGYGSPSAYAGGTAGLSGTTEYHAKDPALAQEGVQAVEDWANNKTSSMQKGSPYPSNSYKNAPDHTPKKQKKKLPKEVNAIYNACMREGNGKGDTKEEQESSCMAIAWSTYKKDKKSSAWDPECDYCGHAMMDHENGEDHCTLCGCDRFEPGARTAAHPGEAGSTDPEYCSDCGSDDTNEATEGTTRYRVCNKCGNAWEEQLTRADEYDSNPPADARSEDVDTMLQDFGGGMAMASTDESDYYAPTRNTKCPRCGEQLVTDDMGHAVCNNCGWDDDEYSKTAARSSLSVREQQDLINEDGVARNMDKLNLDGTHYTIREEEDDLMADHFLW